MLYNIVVVKTKQGDEEMTEERNGKASVGNWDDLAKKPASNSSGGNSNKKLPYMKFDQEKVYRIRLVGKYVTALKYFKPFPAITHPDYKGKDPAWVAGWYPPTKYIIHILDREDGNQLKILEKSYNMFKHFSNFKETEKIDPSGLDAPDFNITVKFPRLPDGKPNKNKPDYIVSAARENSPLTEAEKQIYKEQHLDLSEKYRAYSLEKLQEMWDALPASEKIPPKREAKPGAKSQKPVVKEPEESVPEETVATQEESLAEAVTPAKEGDSTDLF